MGLLSTAADLSKLNRITNADMPLPGELQLQLQPVADAGDFDARYGEAEAKLIPLPYQVRETMLRPEVAGDEWFSIGIGRGPRPGPADSAAVYRVKGQAKHHEQVYKLANRLADWLNDKDRRLMSPAFVPGQDDESAHIIETPAGKTIGFLKP